MTDIHIVLLVTLHVLVVAALWDWMEKQNDNDKWG